MEPQPFTIQVAEEVLADLRARLGRVRWPDQIPDSGWSYGTDRDYLRELVVYWRDRYDWRVHEARLNELQQYSVPLAGIDLHFIHQPGVGPNPRPLLLSHGWPGSVWEFHKLIPLLTDPARFGGEPADAFTVVAPSLPGYGFSFRPDQPRFGALEIAEVFASLMSEVLGYQRFAAHGGDWGSFIRGAPGAPNSRGRPSGPDPHHRPSARCGRGLARESTNGCVRRNPPRRLASSHQDWVGRSHLGADRRWSGWHPSGCRRHEGGRRDSVTHDGAGSTERGLSAKHGSGCVARPDRRDVGDP
jgi:hypothetical protein